jgi:hypothetical protein
MSWISDNYEKAALGGAAAVALVFGVVIINNKNAVEESFTRDSIKHNENVSVPGLAKIEAVKTSLEGEHQIVQPDLDGRKVNLMTGVPLYAKRGDPKNPVDLLKSAPVHPPIPNTWWLENDVDPGYSDSPKRDPDEDGFTNMEEYVAKTAPNSFKSHPELATKLRVVGVKTTQYMLKPSDFGSGKYKFKLLNSRGVTRNKMGNDPVVKGEPIVFVQPLMQHRFKFKDLIEKVVKKNGITQRMKIWVIEDLKPNKKGLEYRFNRRGDRRDEGEGVPLGVIDSTVELSLNALGKGGETFKLEENTTFALPFDEKADKKPYLLKKVDVKAKTVEIQYPDEDGQPKTIQLSYSK